MGFTGKTQNVGGLSGSGARKNRPGVPTNTGGAPKGHPSSGKVLYEVKGKGGES